LIRIGIDLGGTKIEIVALDPAGEPVSVERAHGGKGLQDHEVKRPLKNIELGSGGLVLWHEHISMSRNMWHVHRLLGSTRQAAVRRLTCFSIVFKDFCRVRTSS
jgi:hypothetical protein